MVKTYCDGCGKELMRTGEDAVNLDFGGVSMRMNSYYPPIDMTIERGHCKYTPLVNEFQLCRECADAVVLFIEDLMKQEAVAEWVERVRSNEKDSIQGKG